MRLCGRGILEAAQRVPAGMELRVADVLWRGGCAVGDDAVGGRELALIDEAAGNDALLIPPFGWVDERATVARHLRQKACGFLILVLSPQIFDAREHIGGIAAPLGIDGAKQSAGTCRAAADGRPSLVERLRLAKVAKALGLCRASAIEKQVHARLVVGGADEARERGKELVLERLVQALRAPHLADDFRRLCTRSVRHQCPRQHEGAFGGFRLGVAECGKDLSRRRVFVVERALGIAAQRLQVPASRRVRARPPRFHRKARPAAPMSRSPR